MTVEVVVGVVVSDDVPVVVVVGVDDSVVVSVVDVVGVVDCEVVAEEVWLVVGVDLSQFRHPPSANEDTAALSIAAVISHASADASLRYLSNTQLIVPSVPCGPVYSFTTRFKPAATVEQGESDEAPTKT